MYAEEQQSSRGRQDQRERHDPRLGVAVGQHAEQHAPAHARSDHEAERRRRELALKPGIPQERDQVSHDRERREDRERVAEREDPEGLAAEGLEPTQDRSALRYAIREARARACLGRVGGRTIRTLAEVGRLAPDEHRDYADDDQQYQRGENEVGEAPVEPLDQERRERRHRQTPEADPGQSDAHGQTPLAAEPVRDQGLIRDPGHAAEAERSQRVDRVELPQGLDETEKHEAAAHDDGSEGHHPPRAVAVEPGADERRGEARDDGGDGAARRDRGPAPAKVLLEGNEKDGGRVEADPHRDEQDHEGGAHDPPAVERGQIRSGHAFGVAVLSSSISTGTPRGTCTGPAWKTR